MGSPTCHVELIVNDPGNAKAFYNQLFSSWNINPPGPPPSPSYLVIQMGTGTMPNTCPNGSMKKQQVPFNNMAVPFFEVADVQAALDGARGNGGRIVVEKTVHPHLGGDYGIFSDPDGIFIGVYTPP